LQVVLGLAINFHNLLCGEKQGIQTITLTLFSL